MDSCPTRRIQADSHKRVAYFVDRILKGANPADLPVEQPTNFELVINLKDGEADWRDDSAGAVSTGEQNHSVRSSRAGEAIGIKFCLDYAHAGMAVERERDGVMS